MKGGWAGAKVSSASEETGGARRTPVTSRRYGGERPHRSPPRGRDGRATGVVDRSAQRAVSRAESFPHKGEIRSCRVSTMQSQGQPKLGPRLRAARSVFSEPTTMIPMHHQYLCQYCVGP